MMPFFEYMIDQVRRLLSLWADPKIEEAIGANFLYIILTIWIMWIMINMFLIRPLSGGNLFGVVSAHEARNVAMREKAQRDYERSLPKTYTRTRINKRGEVVRETSVTRSADGSTVERQVI